MSTQFVPSSLPQESFFFDRYRNAGDEGGWQKRNT